MPCDTRLKARQTLGQRKTEVKKSVETLDRGLLRKKIKPVIGPKGEITFQGWPESDRDGVTDACAYRMLMITGSSLAKAEIARAEQISGRSVNRQAVNSGVHSHDGGQTWGRD